MIAAPAAQLVQPKLRRKGVRTGAKLMFASAVLLPIAGALTIPADDPFPLFLPLIVFVAGLMRALYARLFEDPVLVIPLATRPAAESFRPAPVLPSSQHPSPTSQGVPDTSDLDQPPDVTERTTRLFNRQ
ncbi:MAG TPA: hypothetical protein VFD58_07535 [Blastocatellia bacterium]|nr:hypothetical protein [Blastocatellia bacterium]